jgi:hypothetical protein
MLALVRMYASVLICFGLCQAMLWQEWKEKPNPATLRMWMTLMLIPDCHHLFFAYYGYFASPHGQFDAAFVAHYSIQGFLTLARLVYLASSPPSRPKSH